MERTQCEQCESIPYAPANSADGFCALWGSKAHCISAERIRRLAWQRAYVMMSHSTGLEREAWQEVMNMVKRQNDAAWWMEHRSDALQMLASEIKLTDWRECRYHVAGRQRKEKPGEKPGLKKREEGEGVQLSGFSAVGLI